MRSERGCRRGWGANIWKEGREGLGCFVDAGMQDSKCDIVEAGTEVVP